ncbi:hypothetical protein F4680DRAFT_442136 [Xylaria scruposa]|nr:hypothetical protein F4680DRAFT_442136 [Xylaria scruposa]
MPIFWALKERTDIEVIAQAVDYHDKNVSKYRFLVDGKHARYVSIAPGMFPLDVRRFGPALIVELPPFPPGDWTYGLIAPDPRTRWPVFRQLSNNPLPKIENTWHPTRIDHLELREIDRSRTNVRLVTHPLFKRPVIVKLAEFPWHIPDLGAETAAYEWLEDKGVGPKFLGHVTEAGRIMGIILENVGETRPAEPRDLKACRAALAKLHSFGIKHGSIHKNNFLVRGKKVILVDFKGAGRSVSNDELEAEYQLVRTAVCDPYGWGLPEEEEEEEEVVVVLTPPSIMKRILNYLSRLLSVRPIRKRYSKLAI